MQLEIPKENLKKRFPKDRRALGRNQSIDLIKGIAIVSMIATHVISILYTGENIILTIIMSWGINISFSLFLFSFTAINGIKAGLNRLSRSSSFKKALSLLFWYYVLALFISYWGTSTLHNSHDLIKIFTLQTLPEYTEFMIAFVIYSFVIALLGNKGVRLFKNLSFVLVLSIAAYIGGQFLSQLSWGIGFVNVIKAQLVGHANIHSFGIISYLPIFSLGLYIGQNLKSINFRRILLYLMGLVIIAYLITYLITGYQWHRWPPTIHFFALGNILIFIILYFFPSTVPKNRVTNYLLYIGKHALLFYILHLLILFTLGGILDLTYSHAYWAFFVFVATMAMSQLLIKILSSKPAILFSEVSIYWNYAFYTFAILMIVLAGGTAFKLQKELDIFQAQDTLFLDYLETVVLPEECLPLPQNLIQKISIDRSWALLGDEFSGSEYDLDYKVDVNQTMYNYIKDEGKLDWAYKIVGTNNETELEYIPLDFAASGQINYRDLSPGKYEIVPLVSNSCSTLTGTAVEINVSYPVYVAWTIDWEGYYIHQEYLDDIASIADKYNAPITHFFTPRFYITKTLSSSQTKIYTDFVKSRRDEKGDSIGLHLHMFKDLWNQVDVETHDEPSWGSTYRGDDGYDVPTSSYTYEEQVKLFNWSKSIFISNGLGNPTMFRAGGWFADEDTLRALQDTGFMLDSSGRTPISFGANQLESPWFLATTTQPYQPNLYNQNSYNLPQLTLWEFPNNGGDSWSLSGESMISRFDANYNGTYTYQKKLITFLSHPEAFKVDSPKIKMLFEKMDIYSNKRDSGPVIYITIDDVYDIWTQ